LLRIPRPLHKVLLARAQRNNVSLNTEIVNQLQEREARMAKEIAATAAKVAAKVAHEKAFQEALNRIEKWAAERGMSIMRLEAPMAKADVDPIMQQPAIDIAAAAAAKIVLAEMAARNRAEKINESNDAAPEPGSGKPEEK
jgi:C4-dicarboxylate-specific signal transduction histidine kinase